MEAAPSPLFNKQMKLGRNKRWCGHSTKSQLCSTACQAVNVLQLEDAQQ
jgi:hypothetical protein